MGEGGWGNKGWGNEEKGVNSAFAFSTAYNV